MILLYYYSAAFILSFILTVAFAYRWHKHFAVYFTVVFTLIPLVNLGYVFRELSHSLEAAVISQKVIYVGGCFLVYFIMLSIFSLCQVPVSKLGRTVMLAFVALIYASVLTIGYSPLFYSRVSYETVGGHGVLVREYGPMHSIFYAMVIAFFAAGILAIVDTWKRKKQVSRKILILLFIPEVVSVICYFSAPLIKGDLELIPAAFVFAQIMYLAIAHRICLYDITDTVTESLLETEDVGFVSVDLEYNYLGSSVAARRIFPEFSELTVDRPAGENAFVSETFLKRLETFRKDEGQSLFYFQRSEEEPIYAVTIQHLFDNGRKKGYQFVISDDTKNQRYIALLSSYNADLEEEVAKKTENLVNMHNKLVLGMATMVESRDNSTGGHIRRTSEGVRILIDEMRADPSFTLSKKFCKDLIKAAPMHDLGKIAVDDAVLRKPGRFTPEEFEKMKAHAAEGARIVHEILKDTDDEEFRVLAENVAHYHHERWDGSGYPKGLKGEEIPIEARVMAIADVYDALVSKRVYKDAMSFEKADGIIMDGMGKHFDKKLEKYYVAARPKLEAFYSEA